MVGKTESRRVAIACQGGGSHTAFTAGVLKRLLREEHEKYDFVALSGTSGGAICALLVWYALLKKDRARASRLLDSFWEDNSAYAPHEKFWNDWFVWINRVQGAVALPEVSPYSTHLSLWAQEQLGKMLEKQVDFEEIEGPLEDPDIPMLLLGAADVKSGEFRAFNSRRDRIEADMILASAAIPTLFRAVHTGGGAYWDGLFSQNPPVRELPDARPDEIWVIQINPEMRAEEPKAMADILDRRNELSGNLSLHQEIYFIEKINDLAGKGLLPDEYRNIMVRRIEMSRPLDSASKLDRSPSFIGGLMDYGEQRAEDFLETLAFEAAWRTRDPEEIIASFAEDARVDLKPPLSGRATYKGSGEIRNFVQEHLAESLRIDPTRHQVAGDKVTWTIKITPDRSADPIQGKAEAVFQKGKIKTLAVETSRE